MQRVVNFVKLFQFLSTPSARRATGRACCFQPVSNYFYPRPPRGGRLNPQIGFCIDGKISIHALREEGDSQQMAGRECIARFLSTPSARRATLYSVPGLYKL